MTLLYVLEQSILVNFLDELGDDDVAGVRQNVVLNARAAAVDHGDHMIKGREKFSAGRHLIENLQDGDRVLLSERGAAVSGSQLQTRAYGKACAVDPGDIYVSAYCAAMDAVNKIERHQNAAVSNWRGN